MIFRKLLGCKICGERENLLYTPEWGLYGRYKGAIGYPYHEECVKDVVCNPENYTNKQVDWAIQIGESLRERKEDIIREEERRALKAETICKLLHKNKDIINEIDEHERDK